MNKLCKKYPYIMRPLIFILLFSGIGTLIIFIAMIIEYRADFITAILGTGFYTLGYLVFMGAILKQVPSLYGWNFDNMLLLFSVSQLIFYISWAFYRYSLSGFFKSIKDGTFDFILKSPLNRKGRIFLSNGVAGGLRKSR